MLWLMSISTWSTPPPTILCDHQRGPLPPMDHLVLRSLWISEAFCLLWTTLSSMNHRDLTNLPLETRVMTGILTYVSTCVLTQVLNLTEPGIMNRNIPDTCLTVGILCNKVSLLLYLDSWTNPVYRSCLDPMSRHQASTYVSTPVSTLSWYYVSFVSPCTGMMIPSAVGNLSAKSLLILSKRYWLWNPGSSS